MHHRRGQRIVLLILCRTVMPAAWAAGEYPRIGAYWIDKKNRFYKSRYEVESMKFLSVADAIIIYPNPGIQKDQYRTRIRETRAINPGLLISPYTNVSEMNPSLSQSVDIAASIGEFVNPNRGGANTAGDPLAKQSDYDRREGGYNQSEIQPRIYPATARTNPLDCN